MLRSRVHLHGARPPVSSLTNEALLFSRGLDGSASSLTGNSALTESRRFSFKYANKPQLPEMRQPTYIHDKRHGIYSNERNIGKARRGLPFITPLYHTHMNLWETDTDASTNRFFRSYVFGQRELHQLLGRPHAFESDEAGGRNGNTAYELATDMRFKGAARPAIANLYYEPEWNRTLYRRHAHGSQLADPRSPLTEEVLGPELMALRDIKSVEHCRAWFDRLQYLIRLHYDAVGDIGEFRSRHTQHVHEFFVAFHDALSSFDFQDTYLVEQFRAARPAELEDLFGVFLEMEANYVNEDFCPRCSLPYATTRYCGEGDTTTPFRKHRGRWAPHQRWGKEWYDVVMRRAEALWTRATEDPYFGTAEHTQRQAEALLRVYVATKQRAKAIDFMHRLRLSKEFLVGRLTVTPAMQESFDRLLDTTPHQHLLTNSFQLQSRASIYTGATNKVPQSPMQMRLDLEMGKLRRQQREEGVVRVPPASWRIDTDSIVPYKLDDQKRITNWREVKAGIEKSFLAVGLPQEAYTAQEWREMVFLQDHLASVAQERAELEQQRLSEEAAAAAAGRGSGGKAVLVFPDRRWYRVFQADAETVNAFGLGPSGTVFTCTSRFHPDPTRVVLSDSGEFYNITDEACRIFGATSGDVLRVPSTKEELVVVGVRASGPESEWTLVGCRGGGSSELVDLGRDVRDMKERFPGITNTHRKAAVPPLDALPLRKIVEDADGKKETNGVLEGEEHLGQVVGVRDGMLYVQWRLLRGGGSELDRSVACPIGTAAEVKRKYTNVKTLGLEALVEPPSWQTPFRNDFSEERLLELQEAPFKKEKWASLIEGKYTPKVKKFGYTQHTTQDDFATKEYQDRLLAKQFSNDPQAFEVIPERRERAVQFLGKWEGQRTHGLPTVDRNELERGWGEAEPIADEEMRVIEQALRDISGRRPGNFLKSPTETQSLQLNESWWAPLHYGWEEHNKEQRAFLDSSEQSLVDNNQLPFKGRIPPFGTSYGIGERIREIAQDYAKGFGLGPHGHSPTHDTTQFNTLGAESDRARRLGYENALVRLFDEKLGMQDLHAWALQQCDGGRAGNVRDLLLSIHEWREMGRPPSLLLSRVLGNYLGEEIEAFNKGLPEGVPQLAVPSPASPGGGGSVWADVDRRAYRLEHAAQHRRSDDEEPMVRQLVLQAALAGVSFDDARYNAFLQQEVLNDFQLRLAAIVGAGIPPDYSLKSANSANVRLSGRVNQLVSARQLAKLLEKFNVSSEGISLVIRGLKSCPEVGTLSETQDFAIPISLINSWAGPRGLLDDGGAGAAAAAGRGGARRGGAGAGGRQDGQETMVVTVLEELSAINDGVAMDVLYTVAENKKNPVLRQEFFLAMLPVFGGNHARVATAYEDYCDGKYVPSVTVAIEAFVSFLGRLAKDPSWNTTGPSSVPFFATDDTTGEYTQLNLLPPTAGAFQFENTLAESIETVERFKRYGILAGPTRAPAAGLLAAKSQSPSYSLGSLQDLVHVRSGNDHGLAAAIKRSPHADAIAKSPAMRTLATSRAAQIATFNRFIHRVMPMLSFYEGVLRQYGGSIERHRAVAVHAAQGLSAALSSELAPNLERDFRMNAERYWRNVLEGRQSDEGTGGGGGRRGSSLGRQNQQQQQQQQNQQRTPGMVESSRSRVLHAVGGGGGGVKPSLGKGAAAAGAAEAQGEAKKRSASGTRNVMDVLKRNKKK